MKKVFLLLIFLSALSLSSFATPPIKPSGNNKEDKFAKGAISVSNNDWSAVLTPQSNSMEKKDGKIYITQTFEIIGSDKISESVYAYILPKNAVLNHIKISGDEDKVIMSESSHFKEFQKPTMMFVDENVFYVYNFHIPFQVGENKNIAVSFSFSESKILATMSDLESSFKDIKSKCPKADFSLESIITVFIAIFICLYLLSKLRDLLEKKAYFEENHTSMDP